MTISNDNLVTNNLNELVAIRASVLGEEFMDDDVDALYNQIYRELVLMMIENPKNIQRATYLLWVAHDLERIADRATNISERTIFMVTGKKWDISDR